jgi:hypothetical protein
LAGSSDGEMVALRTELTLNSASLI